MVDVSAAPSEVEYRWVEGWEPLGFCLALVEDRGCEVVLRQLVNDPATDIVTVDQARRWAWSDDLPDYRTAVEAGSVGGWAVTVELDGYHATMPEVITRVSKGSRAVVIYYSAYAGMSFQWAVDGVVVRSFDPLHYEDVRSWVGAPLPEEAGLTFGLERPLASALACAERLTGVRLTREWLERRDGWIAVGHHPSPDAPAVDPGVDGEEGRRPSPVHGRLPQRLWRLAVVALVAVVAFAAAVARFPNAARAACAIQAGSDRSYSVDMSELRGAEPSQYRLTVRRDGRRVAAAQVCMNVRPAHVSAVVVSNSAREISPGEYDISLSLDPPGAWRGHVVIVEPGGRPASVPIGFSVHVALSAP